jgi:phage-related tail protein
MTEIRKFSLKQVERGIEDALRNFAGQGANSSGEVPEITAVDRIDQMGNSTARAVIEASDSTARDIEEAAQTVVGIANDLLAEAQQLATELRANGNKIGEHLKEFANLANKVSTAMRNTRAEVLNKKEPATTAPVLSFGNMQ